MTIGRRDLFSILIGAVLAPTNSLAQEAQKLWKVGILWHAANLQQEMIMYQPFDEGMRDLGYVEGRNVKFYHTFVDEKFELFQKNTKKLVDEKVDIIMASVAEAAAAASKITDTIPIVFATSGDPVKSGLVKSMRNPGRNITGFSLFYPELAAKHVEMLRDVIPGLSSVAMLWDPANIDHADTLKAAEHAAKPLDIEVVPVSAKSPDDFARAFSDMTKSKAGGLIVLGHSMFRVNAKAIVALAASNRLPAIYAPRDYADAGGLISYGACIPCNFRRSATYIDKILKGAKASDLPVQQPVTFELVVNLKAAKALGLAIPMTLLARADELIE